MNVGVIGSGSIGPDLAYGFISALAKGEERQGLPPGYQKGSPGRRDGAHQGIHQKGLWRGASVSPKVGEGYRAALDPHHGDQGPGRLRLRSGGGHRGSAGQEGDPQEPGGGGLPGLPDRLRHLGDPPGPDRGRGQAPRALLRQPPLLPGLALAARWRWCLSEDEALSAQDGGDPQGPGQGARSSPRTWSASPPTTSSATTAPRPRASCEEGTATPAQVDEIVNDAIGGGGPFNVMDLTRGNLLNIHCLELMRDAADGQQVVRSAAHLRQAGQHALARSQEPRRSDPRRGPGQGGAGPHPGGDHRPHLLRGGQRASATPRELNWLTRMALGFGKGLLDLAEDLGADRVHDICTALRRPHPGLRGAQEHPGQEAARASTAPSRSSGTATSPWSPSAGPR